VKAFSVDTSILLLDILALNGNEETTKVNFPLDEIDGSLSILTITSTVYLEDGDSASFGIYNCACGFKYTGSIKGPDNCLQVKVIASLRTGQLEKSASARTRTGFDVSVLRLAGENRTDGLAELFL
jgi:hypothetical protein